LRAYNKLLFSLALAFGLVNTLLAFLGVNDLSIYFVVSAIAYLIITLVYVHLNPRARSALNSLSLIIFAGFMLIVAVKVVEILK
jgi:hypothetical protein